MSRRIAIVLVLAALEFAQVVRAQIATGPSSHCHVTDGTFTTCPDGSAEWSDVQSTSFPATNSYLYVNQDAARTALFLMYDLPLRTTPLASNESVLVSFDTVEDQPTGAALEHYDISIFGDSHIQVLVFGQPEAAGNIVGAVGFHPSPNSPLPHVVAELQVPLVPGGATVYSPDPNFWSSTLRSTPPPHPC